MKVGRSCWILWIYWLCCGLALQFHDLSLHDITTRAQALSSPFASVNFADELWGSELVRGGAGTRMIC